MKRSHLSLMVTAAAAIAAAITLGGPDDHIGNAEPPAPAAAGNVADLLAQVTVVDDIPEVDGYQRSCGKGKGCVFGPAWNDPLDRSGCDTRNRLLRNVLQDIEFKPGTKECKVVAGRLDPDPYTGQVVDLKHVAIDHLVPLKAAWNAGASHWDPQQRRIFANDMTELIAVSSSANSSKGDSTLSEWLPEAGKCPYVVRYLTVTVKYHLPITVKDHAAAVMACSADPSTKGAN
ncbi:HNH endonuclease family protein [Mycobacterium sp. NPDC049093]